MQRRKLRGGLLLLALCTSTALVGCAEVKGASNTPGRTQRPTAFFKTGQSGTHAPENPDRPRAMDSYLRGKRSIAQGPRVGDVRENPVQPDNGAIAAPPSGSLDAAFEGPASRNAAGRYHRMAKGENLWAVARRYGVTVDEIVRANSLSDPEHLPAGTRIFIPGEVAVKPAPVDDAGREMLEPERPDPAPLVTETSSPAPGQGVYHVIKDGDTVGSLAKFYGVKSRVIREWNEKEIAQGLPAGRTLFIPGAKAGGKAGGKRVIPLDAKTGTPEKVASFRPKPEPVGFQWPLQGPVLSKFGMRNGRPHTGLDIAADEGVPVHAAMAGKVIFSGQMNGYGNVVILDHQNGYFSVYGHNQRNLVKVDRNGAPRMIRAGETIALCGQTGNASRPHVHFEIRRSNDALDPLTLLQRPAAPAVASRPNRFAHGE